MDKESERLINLFSGYEYPDEIKLKEQLSNIGEQFKVYFKNIPPVACSDLFSKMEDYYTLLFDSNRIVKIIFSNSRSLPDDIKEKIEGAVKAYNIKKDV